MALFLVPPLVLGGLLLCFWKFSKVQELSKKAQYWRLSWLGLLASGITWLFYTWLSLVSQPFSSPHGRSLAPEDFTAAHEHTLAGVGWVGACLTLLLLGWPGRRLAALSFGAGVLLVLSGVSQQWYLAHHEQDELRQARYAASIHERTGWQQLVEDEFKQEVDQRGDLYAPVLLQHAPAFPEGVLALDSTLAARVHLSAIPSAQRLTIAAAVQVECIVEANGRISLPHVTQGLGPGYDEEAVRIVQSLSPCVPASRDDGQPVAAVWQLAVPFPAN